MYIFAYIFNSDFCLTGSNNLSHTEKLNWISFEQWRLKDLF